MVLSIRVAAARRLVQVLFILEHSLTLIALSYHTIGGSSILDVQWLSSFNFK